MSTKGGVAARLEACRWMVFPLLVGAYTRVVLFGLSWISMRLAPTLGDFPHRRQAILRDLPALDGLCRWDCGWYEKITRLGYTEYVDANFWPLYPMMSRGLAWLLGVPHQYAMIFWPNLAAVAAFVIIYRVFLDVADEGSAKTGVLLFAAFPFAFFHGAAYPEALMVFFSAAAVLAARRRLFVLSGVLVGLGTLARHLTLFALGALLWELWAARRSDGRRALFTADAVALFIPAFFLLTQMSVLAAAIDDPMAFLGARERGWGAAAWTSVIGVIDRPQLRFLLQIGLSLAPAAGAVLLIRRRAWRSLGCFALPLTVLIWSVGLVSLGRYTASVWPAFLPLGEWLAKKPDLQIPVFAALALLYALLAFLFMHQMVVL